MNSLANWWSVCFKMFFPNVVICGMASTGSATVYENYFYALLFYFLNAKILFFNCFLSELSWRNSFAMKLYGNCYLNRLFSITKFTESRWNDSVFECSEEHWRCSGKVTNFRLAGVEKLFPWWRDSSLLYASFRMTWFYFYSRLGIYIIGKIVFESQRFFFFNCFFFLSKQSRNSLANWWSVCFKMFFSNVFICVVASTTLSHQVWKLFFMLFCFIF